MLIVVRKNKQDNKIKNRRKKHFDLIQNTFLMPQKRCSTKHIFTESEKDSLRDTCTSNVLLNTTDLFLITSFLPVNLSIKKTKQSFHLIQIYVNDYVTLRINEK